MLRRVLLNAGWLLGGKGVSALLSIVYLALVARTLGVGGFGMFATILAYGQFIAGITGFQSWQTIVRYGASHLAQSRLAAVPRVIGFASALDFGAALAGAALAAGLAGLVGAGLGWPAEEQRLAAWFGLSLAVGSRGVPTGILRLFDRFAIASLAECTLPAMRLAGAGIAWAAGGGIGAWLLAWAIAELVTTIVFWWLALRELRSRGIGGIIADPAGVRAENPGIWRFALTTNLSASIGLVWQQLPVLAVGWFAGPAGAGGYRLAAQLGTALVKPTPLLARALFPEFARLAADRDIETLRALMRRVALWTSLLAGLAVLIVALGGRQLLELVGGHGFGFAWPVLLLLTLASAVNMAGFGLEPALVALGAPARALTMRCAAAAAYLAATLALLPILGPAGAAVAAIVGNLCQVVLLHVAFGTLKRV